MANENGSSKWVMWLAGILVTALTTAMFTIGNAVVNNDKDARTRDDKIEDVVSSSVVAQKDINQNILIALKEIQMDVKFIKKETTNGRNNQ